MTVNLYSKDGQTVLEQADMTLEPKPEVILFENRCFVWSNELQRYVQALHVHAWKRPETTTRTNENA